MYRMAESQPIAVRQFSRPLLADSRVAGVSSGRLAVVISTPTIEAKAVTGLLSKD
jgi:hypothetical protein